MKEKKLNFYEVDPRFFKDYSGDGIGDLRGLANKFDYFNFLNIDVIILKNLTAVESIKNIEGSFTKVAPELGMGNDLIEIISKAKESKKKVIIDLPIGFIKKNHNWFKSAEDQDIDSYTDVVKFSSKKVSSDKNYGYSQENKKYYVKDEKTQEIPLNWQSQQVLDHFLAAIRYWSDLGVAGFVFKDFEYLNDETKTEMMNESTLKELRKFYRGIKEINDDLIIAGRSIKIPLKQIKNYTSGSTKVFDYFLSEIVAENNMGEKYGHDVVGKFSPKKLAHDIKVLANDPKNILTFNSQNIGKAVSRWGNDVQFLDESAKSLLLLMHLTGASSSLYAGDEIGTPNIGLTHLDNFQDPDLNERKKRLLSMKITERKFMDAQVLNGAINARALMAWDDSKNGGFSILEKTITPPSTTYKYVNLKRDYATENSILNFNKKLIEFIKKPAYARIINAGKVSVGSLIPGVIKYSLKDAKKEREVLVIVNLTNKTKPIKKIKIGKVVLSTYSKKLYNELPKSLEAYEGVLITKQTNEFFHETQMTKIDKLKANVKMKKETEKIDRLKEKENQLAKEEARKVKEAALLKEQMKREKAEIQAEKTRLKIETENTRQREAAELERSKQHKDVELESLNQREANQKKVAEDFKQTQMIKREKAKEEEKQAAELESLNQREADQKTAEELRITQIMEVEKQKNAKFEEEKEAKEYEKQEAENKTAEKLKQTQMMEREKERQEKIAVKTTVREAKIQAKEIRKREKLERKMQNRDQANEEGIDIDKTTSKELMGDMKITDDKFDQHPPIISHDIDHEVSIENNDELDKAKAEAKADRDFDRSYKDEKTNLTEDELAKTILVDDDFDIDELFNEDDKTKK